MKVALSIIASLFILAAGYFFIVTKDDFEVPPPDADQSSNFTVPVPRRPSILTIPVAADLNNLLLDAKAEMSNPIARASKVVNVPTRTHIELFTTRTVLKEVTKFEDKVEQETRRECERSENRCTKFENRVEKICRNVPWPVSMICDVVEETVCVATEVTCVAYKTVVVSTKVVKVPVQVMEEVEEVFVDIIDKIADLDAELDYTVNFVDLDANLDGQSIRGFVDVDYKLKLNARLNGLEGKIKLAEVNGLTSCGYDEPMRRLRMTFTADLITLESAALALENASWSLEWPNACQLTAFDVQLEDLLDLPLVKDAVTKAIDKALDKARNDANNGLEFQSDLDEVWPALRAPINVGQSGWIAVNPQSVSLAPISGQGKTARTTLSVVAYPVISDAQPVPSGPATAPQAMLGIAEPGIAINFAAGIGFASVAEQLKKAIEREAPDFVTISDLETYASFGRLVVGVRISKPVKGKLYLIGTPTLDDNGTHIAFEDIDFSIDSSNALLKVGDQIFHDKLRDLLRKSAVLDFSAVRDKALQQFGKSDIAIDDKGSALSLTLTSARVNDLIILSQGVYAVFGLQGDAFVSLVP